MVTNGGKPPRCGDDAPSVMALENRGPCAQRGGGVGGAGGWVRRPVRHAASAVDGGRDAPDAAPLQLGRARKDFVLRSHDAAKGEVLWGNQLLAKRDPEPPRGVRAREVRRRGTARRRQSGSGHHQAQALPALPGPEHHGVDDDAFKWLATKQDYDIY